MSQIGQYTTLVGGAVTTLTGNVGGLVGPLLGNINVVGAGGVVVTGNPAANTLTITSAAGGLAWALDAGPAIAMAVGHGYIANNAGLVTATLPAVAAVGDMVAIVGRGAGMYLIAQNAAQVIHFDNQDTTIGIGGSLAATNRYDTIQLICTNTNTDWTVLFSVGNFTVV